jgi:hypothetical protein
MLYAVRALIPGLLVGLLLALSFQYFLPSVQLPNLFSETADLGSTRLQETAGFADMLRNSLQIAGRSVRSVIAYKSARIAAPSVHQTTSTSTSTFDNKAFSTTASMASTKTFFEAIKERRTIYQLTKELSVSDERIKEIASDIILHVPSSFNSQSARIVVLLNQEHDKFWEFTREILKTMVPEDQWAHTEGRINGFKGAYGSVSACRVSSRDKIYNILTFVFVGPLLRRPSPRARPPGAIPHLRAPLPRLVRGHVRHAPVRHVGCA